MSERLKGEKQGNKMFFLKDIEWVVYNIKLQLENPSFFKNLWNSLFSVTWDNGAKPAQLLNNDQNFKVDYAYKIICWLRLEHWQVPGFSSIHKAHQVELLILPTGKALIFY